jgi:hypothetical protein
VAGDGRGEVRPVCCADGELGLRSSGDGVGAVYGEFEGEESERERGRARGGREGGSGFYREMRGERRGHRGEEKRPAMNSIHGHQWRSSLREREEETGGGEGAVDCFRLRGRTDALGGRDGGPAGAASWRRRLGRGKGRREKGARWGPLGRERRP